MRRRARLACLRAIPLPRLSALLAAPLAALLAAAPTAPADAGPWPRAEGSVFLSFSPALDAVRDPERERPRPFDRYEQIYAEIGLGDGWTGGAEAYRENDGEEREWSGMFTLTRLLAQSEGGTVVSGALGAGWEGRPEGFADLRLRPSLHVGRGFSSDYGDGWLAMDVGHEFRPEDGRESSKIEATVGLKPERSLMLFVQLRAERRDLMPDAVTLAPSVAWRAWRSMTLQLSGAQVLKGRPETTLRMNAWLEF
ncbi:hypothetical protein ACQ5SO_15730 [Rhodovulum sp. DZ06]|uniref:hypothetical protein n=1 Tax=Rhodovulum sp. DZ06 TaxID=3425126 RepID=UPI003D343773